MASPRPGATRRIQRVASRKAGGVFYTPRFVVDYIVKATLDPLLDGQSPRTASGIAVLDPACGEGAFLLGAYDHLLAWHLWFYCERLAPLLMAGKGLEAPDVNALLPAYGDALPIVRGPQGDWGLTRAEKQRILFNQVHGIDIGARAVEIAKRALLHAALSHDLEGAALSGEDERALHQNLRHGDALLDPAVHGGLTARGGFDVILGNPPYRREKDYKCSLDAIAATELGKKHRSARMDLWYYFVHRGLDWLKSGGRLSFIVNAYWTAGTGAGKLIRALERECAVEEIFSLGKLRVFPSVSGRHMILRLCKGAAAERTRIKLAPPDAQDAESVISGASPPESFDKPHAALFRGGKLDLLRPRGALESILAGRPLADFGVIRQGIAENPAQINPRTQRKLPALGLEVGEGVFALRPEEVAGLGLMDREKEMLRPYFDLRDLGRYWIAPGPSLSLIYSTKQTWPEESLHPRLRDHLSRFKPIMEARRETMHGAIRWWHLHWPRDPKLWTTPKVVCLQMAARPSFVPVDGDVYTSFSTNVFLRHGSTQEHLWYFAALLNSRLMWAWYMRHAKRRGVNLEINIHVLARSPIQPVRAGVARDRARHDALVELVGEMLALTQRRRSAEEPEERAAAEAESLRVDGEIDRVVYEMYELSPAEIAAVESVTGASA